MELPTVAIDLSQGEGIEVRAGVQHGITNPGGESLRLLVVSAPHSHGDRFQDEGGPR